MKPNLDIETLSDEHRWLARLAHRMVRDRDEAADVVQEAYLAALESPPPSDRPARPWLSRVATNVVRMRHRSSTRRARREESVAMREPEKTAFDDLHRSEAAAVVTRAVHALDEPYRSAVVMRFYGEKSQAEIAEAQGVPVGTAGWRVSEGLKRLRLQLDRDTDGDARRYLMALSPGLGFSTATSAPASAPSQGGITMSKIVIAVAVLLAGVSATVIAQKSLASDGAEKPAEASFLSAERRGAEPSGAAVGPASPAGDFGDTFSLARQMLSGLAGDQATDAAVGQGVDPDRAFQYTYSVADGSADAVPTGILRDLPESGAVLRDCMTAYLERAGTPAQEVRASVRIALQQDPELGVVVADSEFRDSFGGRDAELEECMEAGAFAVRIDEPIGEPGTRLEIDVGIIHDPTMLAAGKQKQILACFDDLKRRKPEAALDGKIHDAEFARCMESTLGSLATLSVVSPSLPGPKGDALEACIEKDVAGSSDPEVVAAAAAACAVDLGLSVLTNVEAPPCAGPEGEEGGCVESRVTSTQIIVP